MSIENRIDSGTGGGVDALDRAFIATEAEFTPQYIDFDNALYCMKEEVREKIFNAIREDGAPCGQGSVDGVDFAWETTHMDENLLVISDDNVDGRNVEHRRIQVASMPN